MINSNTNKLMFIFGVFLIIIISYIVFIKSEENNSKSPAVTNIVLPTSTPDKLIPIISDWNVYQNKKYGFRIDYPSDWKIEEKISDSARQYIDLISPQTLEKQKKVEEQKARGEFYESFASDVSIFYYSSVSEEFANKENKWGAKTLDELIKKNIEIQKIGNIQINGINGVEVIWHGEGDSYSVFIENKGYLYEIIFNNREDKTSLSDTERKIISSFRIL